MPYAQRSHRREIKVLAAMTARGGSGIDYAGREESIWRACCDAPAMAASGLLMTPSMSTTDSFVRAATHFTIPLDTFCCSASTKKTICGEERGARGCERWIELRPASR